MKYRKIYLLISMLSIIGGVDSAQALTCFLDRTGAGGATATGTFTIDTIGSGLTAANFTAWSIVVAVNGNTGATMTNSSGSALDFGNKPPAITSTANSLTITIPAIDGTWNDNDASRFCVRSSTFCANSDPAYQFYAVKNTIMGNKMGEHFRFDGGTGNQDGNTVTSLPAKLTLCCGTTCPTTLTYPSNAPTPISASINLIDNHQPSIFSKQIKMK